MTGWELDSIGNAQFPDLSIPSKFLYKIKANYKEQVMNFLSTLLQGISFVPAIVSGIENIFGGRPGIEKKNTALSFLEAALSMGDAVASRQIVDDVKFRNGLGQIINGVVECLNASAWAKPASPAKATV